MPSLSGIISTMTKAESLTPIVALEATVVGGRTLQAYKRGGEDEARERFLEEITGSIVWLWGVKVLNEFGDSILGKILKSGKDTFDVGTDKVLRTPFENFMKNKAPKFNKTTVAALKGAKVLSSILIANLFIGFVVPKVNHFITNTIRDKKKVRTGDKVELTVNNNAENSKNPSFKGAMNALNVFTNAIENTTTGKLLSTDVGIAGGRMYNARTKEERREIAFRDISSIYFYMWAQGHVIKLMNLVESGKTGRLDPTSSEGLHKHLSEFLKNNGGEMTVEEFRKSALGKNISEIILPEGINFESQELSGHTKFFNKFRKTPKEPLQVAKVSELEKIITDSKLLNRIREMSKLQPKRMGEAVITKAQIIDAINEAAINDPKFLDKAFSDFTCEKGETIGASKKEFKYVAESKLRNFKKLMEEYVDNLCKDAKGGKITQDALDIFNKKNTLFSGLNFVAGFVTAALFLSTFIPKIQYYITKKTTGVDAFPGTYDYGNKEK